jgi:hypothetical protein
MGLGSRLEGGTAQGTTMLHNGCRHRARLANDGEVLEGHLGPAHQAKFSIPFPAPRSRLTSSPKGTCAKWCLHPTLMAPDLGWRVGACAAPVPRLAQHSERTKMARGDRRRVLAVAALHGGAARRGSTGCRGVPRCFGRQRERLRAGDKRDRFRFARDPVCPRARTASRRCFTAPGRRPTTPG